MLAAQDPAMTTRSKGRSSVIKTRSKGKKGRPLTNKKARKRGHGKNKERKVKNRSNVSVKVAEMIEVALLTANSPGRPKNCSASDNFFSQDNEDEANIPDNDEEMPLFQLPDQFDDSSDDESVPGEEMPKLLSRDEDSDEEDSDGEEDSLPGIVTKLTLEEDFETPKKTSPPVLSVSDLLKSIEKHQSEFTSDLPKINQKTTGNSDAYAQNQVKQIKSFIDHLSKCKFFYLFY